MDRSYRYVLCAALLTSPLGAEEPRPRESPRSYDNRDLDRVHSQREQVGFASVPAVREPESRGAALGRANPKSGEEFWRREADAHRGRIAALERTLADLRDKAAATRRPASGQTGKSTSAPPPSFERRITALEARIHDEEMRFLDRARRDGALPGWLR